ncbi:MAG: hypothetical protein GC134_04090 [Proteobacteria bacterium]|nr:hypothetical protein [Pseudomonadota bacterium]
MRSLPFLLTLTATFMSSVAHAGAPVVATTTDVTGRVFISSPENGAFLPLKKGYPLTADQKLAPLAGTHAKLAMGSLSIDVPAQTEVMLGAMSPATAKDPAGYGVKLDRGALRVFAPKGTKDRIAIHTPVGLVHLAPSATADSTLLVEVRVDGTTSASIDGCCATLSTQGGKVDLKGTNLLSIATSSIAVPAAPVQAPEAWLAELKKTMGK